MAKQPHPPHGHRRKPAEPRDVWLCVFELTGSTVPRRFPDKPHVSVTQKVVRPGVDLDAWLKQEAAKKRAPAKGRPKPSRVLYELMPGEYEPGGLHNPFKTPREREAIKKALRKLRDRLLCAGYTIENSSTVWSVYAIELEDDERGKKPAVSKGHVYVGQTSLPVEERVRQHRLGKEYSWKSKPKHSVKCHRLFRRHAPELVPEKWRGPIACREMALKTERDLRLHLERQGYRVVGGMELLGQS